MSDKSQINFTVDSDAKDAVKKRLAHGELTERLRTCVKEIAYGTDVTERERLKDKLSALREEKRDIEHKIDVLKHERDEKEREIERIEQRLDTLMDQDGEFDGYLQALEEDLHSGKRVFVNHGKVERAAEIGGCEPNEVVEALQERNPEIPEEAFREPHPHENPKWDAKQMASR